MEQAAITGIRSFNRTVTQRIGALDDEYLARGRPLGASRLLWEIGAAGADVRALRSRLDLDSGYLSRLLRSLEREGLVVVEPDPSDRRVRRVRLTESGRAELELLDHASDDLARGLLAPLNDTQRDRLIEAMGTVERLLTAGLVGIEVAPPTSVAARFCIRSYVAELDARFDAGFDPERSLALDAADLAPPRGLLLVARLRDEPVGCGALRFHGPRVADVKRMWVAPAVRGLGVGRRILHDLEQRARAQGVGTLRLETNRNLGEAIDLYRSAGYAEVDPFNEEPYAHHWFEKRIG